LILLPTRNSLQCLSDFAWAWKSGPPDSVALPSAGIPRRPASAAVLEGLSHPGCDPRSACCNATRNTFPLKTVTLTVWTNSTSSREAFRGPDRRRPERFPRSCHKTIVLALCSRLTPDAPAPIPSGPREPPCGSKGTRKLLNSPEPWKDAGERRGAPRRFSEN